MILDDIVRDKRRDLALAQAAVPLAELEQRRLFSAARRNLRQALEEHPRAIIAEVKKASPSKGVIRPDFSPVPIATSYAANGAAAISVLTEERYFQGHLDYLAAIRDAVSIPLLRKDFLFEPYQLYEACAFGADAVLLIVAMLSDGLLRELLQVADTLQLSALVEVHDEPELERALASGSRLLGINNRDLRTFRTSLATSERLARLVPADAMVVAESGLETTADIQRLEHAGLHAFLIGETCMRAPDPGAKLAELLRG